MSGSNRKLWYQAFALGGLLVACSIFDFACGGGGGGGGGGGASAGPVAVSSGGIPFGAHTFHHATGSAEIYNPNTGQFVVAGAMHQPRAAVGGVALLDGSVLFAGGLVTGPEDQTPLEFETDSPELFDPKTKTFAQVSSTMKSPRVFHIATILKNGTVLLAGGATAAEVNVGPDDFPILHTVYTAISDSGKTAELYNPFVKKFLPTGDLLKPRLSPGAAPLYDGSVLIAGGASTYDAGGIVNNFGSEGEGLSPTHPLKSAELYDPKTRAFQAAGCMNVARVAPVVAALSNGKVLIVGGDSQSANDDQDICPNPTPAGVSAPSVELYDPTSKSFALISAGSTPPAGARYAFLSAGGFLFAGGSSLVGVVPNFNPTGNPTLVQDAVGGIEQGTADGLGFSTVLATLNIARLDHQVTPLTSGLLLITGGARNRHALMVSSGNCLTDPTFDPDAYLLSAELYDDSSGTSSFTGSMHTQRALHSATLLGDGSVLVAGGYACGEVDGDTTLGLPDEANCLPPSDPGSKKFPENQCVLPSS